jgi:hypothetical protein
MTTYTSIDGWTLHCLQSCIAKGSLPYPTHMAISTRPKKCWKVATNLRSLLFADNALLLRTAFPSKLIQHGPPPFFATLIAPLLYCSHCIPEVQREQQSFPPSPPCLINDEYSRGTPGPILHDRTAAIPPKLEVKRIPLRGKVIVVITAPINDASH